MYFEEEMRWLRGGLESHEDVVHSEPLKSKKIYN